MNEPTTIWQDIGRWTRDSKLAARRAFVMMEAELLRSLVGYVHLHGDGVASRALRKDTIINEKVVVACDRLAERIAAHVLEDDAAPPEPPR